MKKEHIITKNISANIVYYRSLYNLTQYELAQKLNYSDKSISKWERGEGVPSVFVLNELADFFNVSLDDLVNKTHIKPTHKNQMKPLLYSLIVWLVVLIGFSIIIVLQANYPAWHLFLLATSGSGLIFFIFNLVWKKKWFYYISFAVFIFVLATFVHLTLKVKPYLYYISAAAIYLFFSYLLFYLTKKK